jgi:hypothetical protein
MSMKISNDTIRNRTRHLPVEYIQSRKITNLTSFKHFFTKQIKFSMWRLCLSVRDITWATTPSVEFFMKFGSGALNDKLLSRRAFSYNGLGGNYYRHTLLKGLDDFFAQNPSICINVGIQYVHTILIRNRNFVEVDTVRVTRCLERYTNILVAFYTFLDRFGLN